jgi:hypothetical protein|nr:hypothetical protein [Phenylobacterium sp.]
MPRKLLFIAGAAALALLAQAANATTITFDEFPASNNGASLTGAYSLAGVTFAGTNAGIWSGLTGGDPGNWGIEGTNGTQFLGYNSLYADTATFFAAVSSAQLDFSRSNGSSDDTVTLNAFDGASLVDTQTVVLGAINTWSTLSVSGSHITSLTWSATGSAFHPYAVDNFVFAQGGVTPGGVPEPSTWALALIGFGGVGAALRRRRSSLAFA